MKYVAPSSPLSIGGVLDNWIQLFRASFSRCWAVALIAVVGTAVMQFLITPPLPAPGESPLLALQRVLAMMRVDGLLMLLSMLVTLVVNGALLAQQVTIMRGDTPMSFSGALGSGLRRLPQMILAGVLLLLIFAAFCLPIGIGVAMTIAAGHSGHEPGPLSALLILGGLALAVIWIYVFVRLEFWLPAMFVDDCGGAASLGHSWRLVKGHWWRVTMITFVALIIITILNMAITWAATVLGGLFGLQAISALADPAQFIHRMRIVSAVAALGNVLILPLFTAMWLSIYQDLKLRREGGDLTARAEALSGT